MEPRELVYRERFMRYLRTIFKPGMKVLDAGCGSGDMALLISELGCRVIGIDVNCYESWQTRTSERLRFREGSGEKLTFSDNEFDGVISMDALHHMAWPEKALAEMRRVAKKQAPIVIIETNRLNPVTFCRMTLLAKHETFTPKKFFKMISDSDPDHQALMIESRCLPWNAPWLLAMQNKFSDILETLPFLKHWLTYQMAILSGVGEKIGPKIDETEPMSKRQARVAGGVVI